jgi:hyperosmotically inducible protein
LRQAVYAAVEAHVHVANVELSDEVGPRLAGRLNERYAEDEMSILRLLLVTIVVVVAVLWLIGFLGVPGNSPVRVPERADTSDTIARARQSGAEIAERAAIATTKVEETLAEAALTAKIKAKMTLDDLVKARTIDVTTQGTTVTLTGTVQSKAERDRAVTLARETDGVTRVNDELQMR